MLSFNSLNQNRILTSTFKRSISRKPFLKLKNKNSKNNTSVESPVTTKSEPTAQAKGIAKLKKNTTTRKDLFIHDYSILPETLQFRLPNEDEVGKPPKEHSNLIKLIFEQGGIESMDLDANKKLFEKFPLTNVKKLNNRTTRPTSVKMLSSDFIDDSLYNINYGYFAKEAVIFQPDNPFDYKNLAGKDEFMEKWLQAYEKYDKEKLPVLKQNKRPNINNCNNKNKIKDEKDNKKDNIKTESHQIVKPSLQLWHTPTELFQPFYGEGLARYILVNYKLHQYPYNDLIIYEVGAGNGTLMLNILDFLEKNQPDVYERTKYRIIEISSKLFNKQNSRLSRHADKVEVINKSILEWDTKVNEACFFIALEVFDNLSHDVIRYDIETNQPYQGYVVIDENNDFKEFYSPHLDDWARHFLTLREQGEFPIVKLKNHPVNQFKITKEMKNAFNPLRCNLTDAEYIPTRLLKLFEILKTYFPSHQLLASDFSHFDKTIKGYNSPTVQTMYKDNMVNVDSYMVDQGYFDIMFPTDFDVMNDMYKQVVGKISNTCPHEQFLRTWADVDSTTTKSGENPMLELYSNAAFIYS